MGNLPPSIFIDRVSPRGPQWFPRSRVRILLWLGFFALMAFAAGRYYPPLTFFSHDNPPPRTVQAPPLPASAPAPVAPSAPALPEKGILFTAAANGDWHEVDRLLKAGVSPDEPNKGGHETPFRAALKHRYGTIALRLLQAGAVIPPSTTQGLFLLHDATAGDSPELLSKLIERGYSISLPDAQGMTPLMRAALSGAALSTEFLLQQKADPNLPIPDSSPEKGIHGYLLLKAVVLLETPLLTETVRAKVVQTLLNHGAHFSGTLSPAGEKMLRAALVGPTLDLQLLLERKSNPNLKDEAGWSVLHAAVAMGNLEKAQLLLNHGANATLADHRGLTPLWLAENRGFSEVLALMGGPAIPTPPAP